MARMVVDDDKRLDLEKAFLLPTESQAVPAVQAKGGIEGGDVGQLTLELPAVGDVVMEMGTAAIAVVKHLFPQRLQDIAKGQLGPYGVAVRKHMRGNQNIACVP